MKHPHPLIRILSVLFFTLTMTQLSHGQNVWIGTNDVSATTNWSDGLNWSSTFAPTAGDAVKFYNDGAVATPGTINNVLDTSFPVTSVQYGGTNGSHTTLIPSGNTLTISGGLTAGTETDNGNTQQTTNLVTGEGVLSLTGGPLIVRQTTGAGNGSHRATLDLSGLNTLSATITAVSVGIQLAATTHTRGTGTLRLARTNSITCSGAFEVANNTSNPGGANFVYMGQTNRVLANTINIGRRKSAGSLLFDTGLVSPTAVLRGNDGVSRVTTLNVGDNSQETGTTGTSTTGVMDFTGGSVDALVGTMQVGRSKNGTGTGTGGGTGTLTFESGLIDVNTLEVGFQGGANASSGVGTVNVNGTATLVVNTSLRLGFTSGSTGAGGTRGTLNINGGTARVSTITAGSGSLNNVITINSGTLVLTNTAGPGINTFAVTNSTLTVEATLLGTTISATNLAADGANTINVSSVPTLSAYPTQFKLIGYAAGSGNLDSFTLGTLPTTSPALEGFLSNNVAGSSIDLVITNGPVPARILAWDATVDNNWNANPGGTANWKTNAASPSTAFNQLDFVGFDDTAAGLDATNVVLATTVLPSSLTVSNATRTYVFGGAGNISGETALIKQGAGLLILDNAGVNDFTGGISISAGTLQLGNNDSGGSLPSGSIVNNGSLVINRVDDVVVSNNISGTGSFTKNNTDTVSLNAASTFSGPVTVTAGTLKAGNVTALGTGAGNTTVSGGATLDVNGINLTAEPVTVSGSGVGNNGAVVNSGAAQTSALRNVTLAGDTTFGGLSRWDIRNTGGAASLSNSPAASTYRITKVGANQVSLVAVSVEPTLGDIEVREGIFAVQTSTTSLGDPTYTLSVSNGATFGLFGNSVVLQKNVFLADGATVFLESGSTTFGGPITMEGNSIFNIQNATPPTLTLTNSLTGTGSLIKNGSGSLVLNGPSLSYAGGTTNNAGKLIVNGVLSGGGYLLVNGGAFGGNGTNAGTVESFGTLMPGDTAVGTLGVGGDLLPQPGSLFTNDLNTATTVGSGVNDLINVTGNLTAGGGAFYINPLTPLTAGSYTLIQYGGTFSGAFDSVQTTVPTRYGLTLDTTTLGAIKVNVTGGAANLRWNGGVTDSTWDVNVLPNWFNLGTSAADVFFNFDNVLFDDTVGPTNVITVSSPVSPASITNDSSAGGNNFTLTGIGKISGGSGLVKKGTSTLTINTTNDFTGATIIEAGTVKAQNSGSLGATNGSVTVLSGATLDVGGNAVNETINFGLKPFFITGTGVGGNGVIINTLTGHQQNAFQRITLAGNATIGGPGDANAAGNPGRWDMRGGTPILDLGGFTLTKIGSNQVTLVGAFVTGGDIVVNGGVFSAETSTTFTNSGTITVNSQGTLGHFRNDPGAFTRPTVLNGGTIRNIATSGNPTQNDSPISLTANSTLLGSTTAGYPMTFGGVISGAFGLTKLGAGAVVLTNINTYSGSTLVVTGSVVLQGAGSIADSSLITLSNATTLDVFGRTDGTLTLGSGKTLRGNGSVRGSLTAAAGSTVEPGLSALGTLTVTNVVNLQGTASMEIDAAAGTNDLITGASSITYGGNLTVANLSGSPTNGQTFKLFSATSYSGTFATNLPPLSAGLLWDTNNLTVNGTLAVVAAVTEPSTNAQILSVRREGGNIVIHGTNNNVPNTSFRYAVVTSTNLAEPVTNWTGIATNNFNPDGTFDFTNAITSQPRLFYDVKAVP